MKSNIKSKKGFTIIELLVVIVVIGILAAITVVSYSGVTNKANTTKALGLATSVADVANSYAADENNTGFPANAAAINGYTSGVVKLPGGITVAAAAQNTPAKAAGTTTVSYMSTANNLGGCIAYFDFTSTTSPYLKYIYVGDGDSANFGLATPTCT